MCPLHAIIENARIGNISYQSKSAMRTHDFVIERDEDTGLHVGYGPGWPGAHTQGTDVEEVERNLREVIAMLLEDGEPDLNSRFIGVRQIQVA